MFIRKSIKDIENRFTALTNFFVHDAYFNHDEPSDSGLWRFLSRKTGLKPNHFILYFVICNKFFENDYQPVHLYQEYLSRISGFSVRTVRNAIQQWQEADLPIVEVFYPPKHQLITGEWINDANLYRPTLYYNAIGRKFVDLNSIAASYEQELPIDTPSNVPMAATGHESRNDMPTSTYTLHDMDGIC